MASIFDAYAQSYNRALNQEAKLADALRVANLQRQQQEIQQAQENRQARQFDVTFPLLQAQTANQLTESELYRDLYSRPEFRQSFMTQNLTGAQLRALQNQAAFNAWSNMTPEQQARAYSPAILKNLVSAEELQTAYDIASGNEEAIKRRFPGAVKGQFGYEINGIPLIASATGMYRMAEAKRMNDFYLNQGKSPESAKTDMESMAGQSQVRAIDNAIEAEQPVTPTPAVTAQPTMQSANSLQSMASIPEPPRLLKSSGPRSAPAINPAWTEWATATGNLPTGKGVTFSDIFAPTPTYINPQYEEAARLWR